MAKKKNYTERFEMKISEHEKETLEFSAGYMGISKSEVVRKLIANLYEEHIKALMEE